MSALRWIGITASACIVAVLMSACVAPDVDVIGALGVTVDEDARPVLVVEPCAGAAILVTLTYNREGLTDDEENEEIARWTSAEPAVGTSKLVLHAPSAPWHGEGINLAFDRGYIAGAQGDGDKQVLTQVAFTGTQLAEMKPGMVYRNDPNPGVTTLVARTPADFTAEICSRGSQASR